MLPRSPVGAALLMLATSAIATVMVVGVVAPVQLSEPGMLRVAALPAGPSSSSVAPYCGDGFCNGSETCVDCSAECGFCSTSSAAPYCGDGICNGVEECDDTSYCSPYDLGCSYFAAPYGNVSCYGNCTVNATGCSMAICGNWMVDFGEECDDGNTSNGDGCSSSCQNEPSSSAATSEPTSTPTSSAGSSCPYGAGTCVCNSCVRWNVTVGGVGEGSGLQYCDGAGTCADYNGSFTLQQQPSQEAYCQWSDTSLMACPSYPTWVIDLDAGTPWMMANRTPDDLLYQIDAGSLPVSCDGSMTFNLNDYFGGYCTNYPVTLVITADTSLCGGADPYVACAAASSSAPPTSTPTSAPSSSSSSSACIPDSECCDAFGAFSTAGTACTDDANECTDDVCDGAGACTHPYTTYGEACTDGGNECITYVCNGSGVCGVNDVLGTACTDDANECTDDICNGGGTCTHPNKTAGTACTADGNECTDDECDGAGSCGVNTTVGTACSPDVNECTDDQCDGMGMCAHPNKASGTACTPDGNVCTDDECDGMGVCGVGAISGTPCASDANECTDDECDGAGTCDHPNTSYGVACSSDANECTDDICDGLGSCNPPSVIGTACTDDGNECTDDECDGAGMCSHPNVADGTACASGTCQSGVCTAASSSASSSSSSSYACVPDSTCCDSNGQYLSNGTACPDDANECTNDVCNGAGVCTHPNKALNTPCSSDANECTDDVCDGAGVCGMNSSPGDPCTSDGNECTDDECDGSGVCAHPPSTLGTACTSDGNVCTTDQCDGAGACGIDVASGESCTPDANECTDDECNGSGMCSHPNSAYGTVCSDDLNECTTDVCDGEGACNVNVPDGTPCTGGLCTSGICTWQCIVGEECCDANGQYESAGTSCAPDANECTNDVCDGAGMCTHPNKTLGVACTSDGNQCTNDVCNGAGSCGVNETNGTSCTDPAVGLCQAGTCTYDCIAGSECCDADGQYATAGASCTDDANECTNDVCNSSGVCTHPNKASGVSCTSDGNVCTNDECDGSGNCGVNTSSGTACTPDANECTDDECDGAGTCDHPNTSYGVACSSDANECTDDICDGLGSCNPPSVIGTACTDDGNECTDDECDGAGMCSHPNVADGTACTSGTCQSGVCTPASSSSSSSEPPSSSSASSYQCVPDSTCCDSNGQYQSNGTACADDANECTNDVCNGAGVCTHPNKALNTPCSSDANECTNDVCDGSGSCGVDYADGTSCLSDGNECTDDYCYAGVCINDPYLYGVFCDISDYDANECTDDWCDGAGACIHPNVVDGTSCTGGSCQTGMCVAPSSSSVASSSSSSSVATSAASSYACVPNSTCCNASGVYETVGTACTNGGNVCVDYICDGSGTCGIPSSPGDPCTTDGNECTEDACDGNATCDHTPVANGTACTGGTCQAGTCVPHSSSTSSSVSSSVSSSASSAPVCGDMVISGSEECDIDNPSTLVDEASCPDAYHYCDVEDYPMNPALASCVCTIDEYCGDGIVNGSEECDYAAPGETFCTLGCVEPPGGDGGTDGGPSSATTSSSTSSVSTSSASSEIMVWCCDPATEIVNTTPQPISACGGTKFNINRVSYAQAEDRCKPEMWCCLHNNFTSCGNAAFVPIGATQQNECWGANFTRGTIYYSPADAVACSNVCN